MRYRITGPDGGTYEIDAPDDAALNQALSQMFGGFTTAPLADPNEFADLNVPDSTPAAPASASEPDWTDTIMRGAAGFLGAPVDALNTVLDVPSRLGMNFPAMSDTPIGGSQSIYGAMQGVTGRAERGEIAAAHPNVDMSGQGASAWERFMYGNMANPDAQRLFMENNYGPENEAWYRLADAFGGPTDRVVIRDGDTERLFNPPGLDWGDAAEGASTIPGMFGAVAGGLASVPAYALGGVPGVGASAVASSVGYELVDEAVKRLFEENRATEPSIIQDVLPRAGQEALIDTIMGAGLGGAAHGAHKVFNVARAPFARTASDPLATEFRSASQRLRDQGYDIAPLASEEGAGGFVPRMEGILEKLPGSSEALQAHRAQGDAAISAFQRDMIGDTDPNLAGRAAVGELQGQQDALYARQQQALSDVDTQLGGSEAHLAARQGPEVGAQEAGQALRTGLEGRLQDFRDEAKRLYDTAREMPGGQDPIVDMTAVKNIVGDIRANLPPQASGEASQQFAPDGLTRFLQGVDNIADNITIDQARQMRAMIDDALDNDNIMPGVPKRYLSQLRGALTSTMDASVARAGSPELQQALTAANTFYRDNIDQFHRKGVSNVYRDPTQPGYIEDNQLVPRLVSGRGNPGLIASTRETLGVDSPEWAAVRRSAIEDILGSGRNETLYGREVVNVDNLIDRLNRLDNEVITELFGVTDAQQLRALAVDISNRAKYLDADALSPRGNQNILDQLRQAAADHDTLMREYRNDVIGPFLRDVDGASARLKPEELVPWLYRTATPDEILQVMGKLPADMRDEVQRGVVADIVENAISKSQDGVQAVRRLISGESAPASGENIASVLGAGGDNTARQQAERISALLPPEVRQNLQDLAIITARRQERDATTQAVGGLAAGAAVSNMMRSPMVALTSAVNARIVAAIVTAPGFRRWVTNAKRTQLSATDSAMGVALSPLAVRSMGGAISEFSDRELQAAIDWLNSGASQIDDGGERRLSPPGGAASWADYFGAQQNAPEPRLEDLIMVDR